MGTIAVAVASRAALCAPKGLVPRFIAIVTLPFLLSVVSAASAPVSDIRSVGPNVQTDTIEYKLAVVDAGTYVKPDDLVVARFRSLLSQLETRWRESTTRVADMSVATKNQLRKVGVDQKILGFMEGMNSIKPVAGKGFAEYAAFYVTIREQGRSHSVAIAALRVAKATDFPR